MLTKEEIIKDWLPRYTGTALDDFGEYVLLTNFSEYVRIFSGKFKAGINGSDRPMQTCTNNNGLTIINFGMGSANAATVMDLLVAIKPKGVLFLGKCGGLKRTTEIGHFILPIAAIRGEGTSNDYAPPEVPALPSFKLHKFCLGDSRRAQLRVSHRSRLHHQQTSVGTRCQLQKTPRTAAGYRHRHGNRDAVHRRAS